MLTQDGPLSPIAVALIAAVVAGEQLWRRRDELASDRPAPAARGERAGSPAVDWAGLAIIAAVFGLFVGAGALLGGGSPALIGFPAGLVVRDLVLLAR